MIVYQDNQTLEISNNDLQLSAWIYSINLLYLSIKIAWAIQPNMYLQTNTTFSHNLWGQKCLKARDFVFEVKTLRPNKDEKSTEIYYVGVMIRI